MTHVQSMRVRSVADAHSSRDQIQDGQKPRARTVKNTCATLDISRSHLYSLFAKGQVRFIKIGRRTLVPEAEIDRLLEEGV